MTNRKSIRKKWYWIAGILFILIASGAWYGMKYYRYLFHTYTELTETDKVLFIPTGAQFDQVVDSLFLHQVIEDKEAFSWIASVRKYDKHIKPGRYILQPGITYDDLVTRLRSGDQDPLRLVLQEVRTLDELALLLSEHLEPDQSSFSSVLRADDRFSDYSVSEQTMMTIFTPNTYEFFWNTTAENTVERLYRETQKFWKGERTKKLEELGMSKEEVYTLASIVYAETKMKDEAATIAGVYMNRLRNNIPLQADPTLIFAKGDFTIKRVLNEDKKVDSPYNTYAHTGLPPGPINMPPIAWIDAVLNYQKHGYIFFCAREDFSGYHNFAVTNAQHERNAAKYRRALNARRIYR